MAADIFVKLTGKVNTPKGDATEKDHKEWFVVKSLSWGMERSVDTEDLGSQQRGYGNAKFNKVVLTSEFGIGSLLLAQAAASGTNYTTVQIDLCRAKGDGSAGLQVYLTYILKDAIVFKWDMSAAENDVPTENWELAYRQLGIAYSAVDNDMKAQTPEKFGWDTVEQIYTAVA